MGQVAGMLGVSDGERRHDPQVRAHALGNDPATRAARRVLVSLRRDRDDRRPAKLVSTKIPGALIAVVGSIVGQLGLRPRRARRRRPRARCRAACRTSACPASALGDVPQLRRHRGLDLRRHPGAERGHLARVRRALQGALRREQRHGRPRRGEHRRPASPARSSSTAARRRPQIVDSAGGRTPARVPHDGGRRAGRAAVPHRAAPVPPERASWPRSCSSSGSSSSTSRACAGSAAPAT